MTIAEAVLDTSAILAIVLEEPGADLVMEIGQACVSAANLAEIVHVLRRRGYDLAGFDTSPFDIHPLDEVDAIETGLMKTRARSRGLSLGDCACLVLAKRLGLPAVTADRAWAELDLGVEVVLIR